MFQHAIFMFFALIDWKIFEKKKNNQHRLSPQVILDKMKSIKYPTRQNSSKYNGKMVGKIDIPNHRNLKCYQ